MSRSEHRRTGDGGTAPLRVALDQGAAPGRDPGGALTRLAGVARAAADSGARLLVGPEMSLTGYNIGADVARLAEPSDGPLAQEVGRIAVETGTAIVYGYPERDRGRIYNAVQLVDAGGEPLAGYRKTHLFGELDRGAYSPGETPVVQAVLDGLRIGMLICYDVEFPEAVRAHAVSGTELLLVPTALMHPQTTIATSLVPARAFESQLHIAYVNRCDSEGELDYCGLSCLAAPDGTEPLRAGTGEELLVAEIDPAVLRTARRDNTYLADRRPELYASLTETVAR